MLKRSSLFSTVTLLGNGRSNLKVGVFILHCASLGRSMEQGQELHLKSGSSLREVTECLTLGRTCRLRSLLGHNSLSGLVVSLISRLCRPLTFTEDDSE